MKTVGGDAFKMSIFPYLQDQMSRNGDSRQSAKKRQIAKPSTR